jgi:hypothetical protein
MKNSKQNKQDTFLFGKFNVTRNFLPMIFTNQCTNIGFWIQRISNLGLEKKKKEEFIFDSILSKDIHHHLSIERVGKLKTYHKFLGCFDEAFQEGIKDGVLDKDTRSTETDFSLVCKAGTNRGWNAFVQVGIRKDNVGILATKLQGDLLVEGSRKLDDLLTRASSSRKRDQRDFGMRHKRGSRTGSRSKDHVYHSRRNPGFL